MGNAASTIAPIFVSHGAPTLLLGRSPARDFLVSLGAERPLAIVVISAHWGTAMASISVAAQHQTLHDFSGFPAELYKIQYAAPGDPALAEKIADSLANAGLRAAITTRALDHGAWVPLMLAWPDAAIPVVQISLQPRLGPGHHLALGRALAGLSQQGVLVLGSGGMTHNLAQLQAEETTSAPGWVSAFAAWMEQALIEGRSCDLLSYRALAPFAVQNHPTDEHLLPLFVALGAAGAGAVGQKIHTSVSHGVLTMDAYRFVAKTL
jgi:4,5-DOPA dioxygenase extradiol